MTRRIVISCDACLLEGVSSDEDATTSSFVISSIGSFSLDLCDQHRTELTKPLADVAGEYGVWEGKRPRAVPRTTGAIPDPDTRKGMKPAGGRQFECMLCTTDYASRGGLMEHYVRSHGFTSSPNGGKAALMEDVYGTRCPICGDGGQWWRRHVADEHGMNATEAMMALKHGQIEDPFGVLELVRKKARQ